METEKCIMIYKIEENSNKLKILGDEFVRNNENRGKMIIKNKKHKIKEFIVIKNNNINDKLKIRIILNKNLYNFSFMFKDCESLIKFYYDDYENNSNLDQNNFDLSEENTISIDNEIKYNYSDVVLYEGIKEDYTDFNLSTITKSEKRDLDTVIYFNNQLTYYQNYFSILIGVFSGCSSLSSLPNISHLDSRIVLDMNGIFYNCSSLTSLPDISKWNIKNVDDMSGIFAGCSSLTSLPDIS